MATSGSAWPKGLAGVAMRARAKRRAAPGSLITMIGPMVAAPATLSGAKQNEMWSRSRRMSEPIRRGIRIAGMMYNNLKRCRRNGSAERRSQRTPRERIAKIIDFKRFRAWTRGQKLTLWFRRIPDEASCREPRHHRPATPLELRQVRIILDWLPRSLDHGPAREDFGRVRLFAAEREVAASVFQLFPASLL